MEKSKMYLKQNLLQSLKVFAFVLSVFFNALC